MMMMMMMTMENVAWLLSTAIIEAGREERSLNGSEAFCEYPFFLTIWSVPLM
jgi:hypothetical protein